jgi:hypothetical protein
MYFPSSPCVSPSTAPWDAISDFRRRNLQADPGRTLRRNPRTSGDANTGNYLFPFRHSIRIHLTYAQLHFIATTPDSNVLGRAMAHWTFIPLLGKQANIYIGQMKLEALWIISNASDFVCPVRFREALGSITQSLE